MKFILDANISWPLIKLIEIDFVDVIHAKDIPISQPADDLSIWNFAKQNQYSIITLDYDFHEMAFCINVSLK